MRHISEKEFNVRMKKIQNKNASIERKRKLKEEKNKYGFKIKFKLPSTSKLIVLVVFLMCIEILIFTQYASIRLNDASVLVTLLGIPLALIPTILGYYNKARAENTKDGLVYDKTMYELSQQNIYITSDDEDNDAVG